MKNLITLAIIFFTTLTMYSQTPELMSYQAVVRDADSELLTDQAVGMKISILEDTASGTPVYVETQNPSTNSNGLLSLQVGAGTVVSGDITTIDWANHDYFIKTETDPTGGENYTIAGTSQILSVPYALLSKNVINDLVDDADNDPSNEYNTGVVLNGTNLSIIDGGSTLTTDLSSLQGQGPQGEIGPQGIQGETGADGANGTDGADGATGAAGSNGTDGAQGATGSQGIQGDTGPTGAAGSNGVDGTNGTDGADGATGPQGETGGALPTYNVNTYYEELGGYVIQISPNGKHGLVAAMQDQGISDWFTATNLLSNPNNHNAAGKEFLDWRMPSKRELELLYEQKDAVGGFSNNYYWSSTEIDNGHAWEQNFGSGNQYNFNKYDSNVVRAVRAF